MTSLASWSSHASSPGATDKYNLSTVPIARGLNYGSARSRGGGGMSNKVIGMGPGESHGMDGKSVKGLGRKVKPLRLQNGETVHIDLLCDRCGYENPPFHKRLRCDTCGVPLTQLHPQDATAGKNTLTTYTGQAAFSPASSRKLERKNQDRQNLKEYQSNLISSSGTPTPKMKQLVDMASSMQDGGGCRNKAAGGLSNRRGGLGAGARHGMAAGAIWHLPASTREVRLGNGDVITLDVLCRKCGYEQLPDWRGMRCQNCREALDQLGTLLTNHQFRAVGTHTAYKNKQKRAKVLARKLNGNGKSKKSDFISTEYGASHGKSEHVFGFSGLSIRDIVRKAATGAVSEDGSVAGSRSPPRAKPSLSNLRHETNDVIGKWVCAIDAATGDDYFFNKKTKKVTWNCPRELEGLL